MTPNVPKHGNILLTFPTPVSARVCPDAEPVNAALRAYVLDLEAKSDGMTRTNVGGWHSDDDLFSWPVPQITTLRDWAIESVREATSMLCGEALQNLKAHVELEGWANISRDGNYNKIHNHSEWTWSGVYYVSTGQPDPAVRESGLIEFIDPRMGVDSVKLPGNPYGGQMHIAPVPGLMLVFPSWLQHWVHPFRGTGERISLAFNVRLKFSPQ